MMDKKGQGGGLVTGLVMAIAGLVIGTIIAFIVVSTLADAELLTSGRTTQTVSNETGGYLNSTGYTLDESADSFFPVDGTFTLTLILNATDNSSVALTNATTSSAGVVTNATAAVLTLDEVLYSYTYTREATEEQATDNLRGNFSAGIDNVSEKLPTVLLVAAIVLILGVLAILVAIWQRMNIGGSGSGI